jgi:hypothetical protein
LNELKASILFFEGPRFKCGPETHYLDWGLLPFPLYHPMYMRYYFKISHNCFHIPSNPYLSYHLTLHSSCSCESTVLKHHSIKQNNYNEFSDIQYGPLQHTPKDDNTSGNAHVQETCSAGCQKDFKWIRLLTKKLMKCTIPVNRTWTIKTKTPFEHL